VQGNGLPSHRHIPHNPSLTSAPAALPAYLEQAHETTQMTVETMKKLLKSLDDKFGKITKNA
jgi:hypothetical protein